MACICSLYASMDTVPSPSGVDWIGMDQRAWDNVPSVPFSTRARFALSDKEREDLRATNHHTLHELSVPRSLPRPKRKKKSEDKSPSQKARQQDRSPSRADWTQYYSSAHRKVYYHNFFTGVTLWDLPTSEELAASPPHGTPADTQNTNILVDSEDQADTTTKCIIVVCHPDPRPYFSHSPAAAQPKRPSSAATVQRLTHSCVTPSKIGDVSAQATPGTRPHTSCGHRNSGNMKSSFEESQLVFSPSLSLSPNPKPNE